jgi:nicotinamide-nucleotide amidase
MTFSVSILATGSELLDGRVVDTNSNFVAKELSERGLKLRRVLTVDDDLAELVAGLKELAAVSDVIITSGGLGPTTDDLTRDAVSSFFGVSLSENPEGRKHLEEFYKKRNRPLDVTNLKQALLPDGSVMIPNELGTAPGFIVSGAGHPTVCSLSGVPREFKSMFLASVWPLIESHTKGAESLQRVTFKTFGLPESTVGKLVEGVRLPDDIVVSYRAAFPEVHVVLKAPKSFSLQNHAESVRSAIGSACIYAQDPAITFAQATHDALLKHGLTVAAAESCTGGLISEMLTRTPGASATFKGGVVAYDNSIKEGVLNVPSETISAYGAVSAQTVKAMAQAVKELCGASIGLSVSGIAGPTGGSAEKPVGTFFIGISTPTTSFEVRSLYMGERFNIRMYAAYVALDLVRRVVTGIPRPDSYPEIR